MNTVILMMKVVSEHQRPDNILQFERRSNPVTTDGTDIWYFQYDTNGMPIGFIFNGTKYFYMTNQFGDVF